jgi:hypothetical protein
MSQMNGHDIALPGGGPIKLLPWIAFGGPRFLVETMRMSLLIALPAWVSAVILPIVLLGAAGWVTGIGRRVAAVVAIYMVAFSIAGLKLDIFWGAITNPILAFGLVWSVPALRDLVGALSGSRGGLDGKQGHP